MCLYMISASRTDWRAISRLRWYGRRRLTYVSRPAVHASCPCCGGRVRLLPSGRVVRHGLVFMHEGHHDRPIVCRLPCRASGQTLARANALHAEDLGRRYVVSVTVTS